MPITKYPIATYMAGQPLQYDPGTTYAYSNFGFSLLGQVIETLTGLPYEQYVIRNILKPLGIKRMKLGRTLPQYRLYDEVKYHSVWNGPTVFNNSGAGVPGPYRAFNLENMDSHGGWLASAVDLVRFATTFDHPASSPILNPESINTTFALPENINPAQYHPGDWYYACGWNVRDYGSGVKNTWHNGSLPGTYTELVRIMNIFGNRLPYDVNWCVLFDQRDDPSGYDYSQIDYLINNAILSVQTWPDIDLFGRYFSTPMAPVMELLL